MTILSKIAYMHAAEIMLVFTRPRVLGVVPTVGEKGVELKGGETGASYLTPLHAPLYELRTNSEHNNTIGV